MIPCPIGEEYLPYQAEGIMMAKDRSAVLFGDEPGLGKTVQAIGWLNCHPEVESALVVCPASLKINWRREIDKWLINPSVEVEIINYDVLHKLDLSRRWGTVILDEAQYVKNRTAMRSKLAKRIIADNKLALTGTPILNKPIELWSVLNWLDPKAWPAPSYMRYALRYCGAYQGRWGWVMDGATHLDELREILRPVMIRRLKSDVLKQLPPKRRQIIELPKDGIDGHLKRQIAEANQRIDKIHRDYASDARKLESNLQVAWQEMAQLRHETGMVKIPMALDIIHDSIASNGKVVVFAHHRDVIEDLKESLIDYNPVVIHGGTTQANRQEAVDRFQNDAEVKVFIGQIQAAGVGLTLTAASTVIFVELDWTPGIVSQAEDRCHRIGQRDAVLVLHLVLEDSLDARMAKALVKKQDIIDKALDHKPEKEEGIAC